MVHSGMLTLGFGFLQPAMLGWAAAALIPILIHLWHRHRYHDLDWAAADFVLAALRTERRRILLRQYFLLFLRILAILLIVCAAARPTFQRPMIAATYHETTGWLFVIDDSLSMEYTRDGEPLFDVAVQRIRSLVQSATEGDAFLLLRGASPVKWLVRQPVYDKASFLSELNRLRYRETTSDWPTVLRFLEQRLKELPQEEPRLGRFVVVIVTDGQETNWRALQISADATRDQDASRTSPFPPEFQLPDLAETSVVLLQVNQPFNTAISELNVYPASAVAGQEVVFSGIVKTYGRGGAQPKNLEWLVDGRKVAELPLNWTDSDETSFRWTYQFDSVGDHVVTAQLPPDNLAPDNQRHVVVSVKKQRAILCVDGRPSPLPFQGATGYLRAALASYGVVTGNVSQRIDVIPEGRLAETDWSQYEAVFLCDVSRITLGEARGLREFVESGGGLIICLGPKVNVQAYNESLGQLTSEGVKLLPGELQAPVSIAESVIDPLNFRHPIVQVFQGRWASSLLTVPIRTYMPLKLSRTEEAEIALRMSNGDPLILTKAIGLGRVVVVTTSADLSWTSLPLWTSYVPLILEIQSYATSGHVEARTVTAGDSIGQILPRAWQVGSDKVAIDTPKGERVEESLGLVGKHVRWSHADTEYTGVYRTETRTPSGTSQISLFAANPPLAESDVRQWDFPFFVEQVLPGASCVSESEPQRIVPADFKSAPRASPVSRWLLYFVIAVFLCELYLGRQTPGA